MGLYSPANHSSAGITLPFSFSFWCPWFITSGSHGHLAGSKPFQGVRTTWPGLHHSVPAGIALWVCRKWEIDSTQTHHQSELSP